MLIYGLVGIYLHVVSVCVLTERDVHMLHDEEEEKQEMDHRELPHQVISPHLSQDM